MSKVGRNEPCPCGSGKKYKKCCYAVELEKEIAEIQYPNNPESQWVEEEEEHALLDQDFTKDIDDEEDEYSDIDDLEEDGDDDDDDEVDDDEEEDEQFLFGKDDETEEPFDNEYPDINEDDTKKVDEWWDIYEKLEEQAEIIQHINNFLENNPIEVGLNLGLEKEVLFELISNSLKKGCLDETMNYMMLFRDKYPEIYMKSASYYDSDIITWLLINNRVKEIGKFLSYFEKDPEEHIDELLSTINFLRSIDQCHAVIPFVKSIYKAIWFSDKVYNVSEIADIPTIEIFSKYIEKKNTDNDFIKLIEDLKSLELNFDEYVFSSEFWIDKFNDYQREFISWDESVPKKKGQFMKKIYAISENFMRFIKQHKRVSFYTAEYYSKLIYQYYAHIISSEIRPKKLFYFPYNQIDTNIGQITRGFYAYEPTKAISLLNAINYFSEYLFECKNFTQQERDEVFRSTKQLYEVIYKTFKDREIGTLVYDKFPYFG